MDMASDSELLEFLYVVPVGVCRFDRDGTIEIANPKIAQLFMPIAGPGSVKSMREFLRIAAPDLIDFLATHDGEPGVVVDSETLKIEPARMAFPAARPMVISLTITALSGAKFMASITDITTEHERELRRINAEERLKAVIDNIVDYAIFSIDLTGRIDTWNRSGQRLFGFEDSVALSRQLDEVIPLRALKRLSLDSVLARSREAGWADIDGEIVRSDGSTFWSDGLVAPVVVEDTVTGYSVILRDATEQHHARLALEKAAFTDPLTGLMNRRAFFSSAHDRLSQGKPAPFAVMMVDIDHFKQVNDRYGHDSGDLVIQEVARQLRVAFRSQDLLCRFGGEEFVVLMPDIGLDRVRVIAEEVRQTIQKAEVFCPGGDRIHITISAGVDVLTPDTIYRPGLLDAVIKIADNRLYEAKNAGRNRIVASSGQTASPDPRPPVQAAEESNVAT